MPSRRPVWAKAKEALEFCAATALLGCLRLLPYRLSIALSEAVGMALGRAIPRWKAISDENLARALPGLSREEASRIRDGALRNIGRVAFALAKLPRWSTPTVKKRVEFVGLDHFRAARAKGRGVMLLTAHLGNWELGALAHGAAVGPLHVMVRPIRNRLVDRLVERLRCSHGNRVISKTKAAREVLRVLRANGTVGILADQNAMPEEAVFVEFFGRVASANKGFAQLAIRSGAAVIPATACWDARTMRHVVSYGPEIEVVRTADSEEDVRDNTQAFQRVLEDRIRAHPEQWLWMHRRWNTQPRSD